MKQISSALATHLQGSVTTLATCWKITRRDAIILGFCDHDADIMYDGVTYRAASGFSASAVESSSALNVDNMDLEGLLNHEAITEADLLAGRYDFAGVEIFIVNYADLSQGAMHLRSGTLGEVQWRGGQCVAELRGLTQALNTRIGSHYSPSCRADFGDARCKINLASYTHSGSITQSINQQIMVDAARSETDGYFAQGRLQFTSGANAGLVMEVREFSDGRFTLVLPMPFAVAVGDSYQAVAGCDKTISTCGVRFQNVINFRGEPFVPGTDRLMETSSTRNDKR